MPALSREILSLFDEALVREASLLSAMSIIASGFAVTWIFALLSTQRPIDKNLPVFLEKLREHTSRNTAAGRLHMRFRSILRHASQLPISLSPRKQALNRGTARAEYQDLQGICQPKMRARRVPAEGRIKKGIVQPQVSQGGKRSKALAGRVFLRHAKRWGLTGDPCIPPWFPL
jgi:hypothetical protein